MPVQRGLVPPAILTTTLILIMCAVGWGALGVFSFADPDAMPTAAHRYLCILLATVTMGAAMVHLAARVVRIVRETAQTAPVTVCGYAEGYTDGLDAAPVSPAVARLVPSRR